MIVFAGPNGSGKSTVVDTALALEQCPKVFICPDNFIAPKDKENVEAYIAAMQKAESMRYAHIVLGNSFSFETVLSTASKLEFIRYAKLQGYSVHVVYVTTESPAINIERVKIRVAHGGHGVPEEKIVSRYEKSMNLMFDVINEAHSADFYDNSGDAPLFVASKIGGVIGVQGNAPLWLESKVLSKARGRGISIVTITKPSTN